MQSWKQAIEILVRFIDERATENPTLSEISSQIGYSPYYCSEQFHRLSGMTIRAYMAKRRLRLAADALRDTDKSIVEIALDCGFSSQQALTRAFTHAYGCAPSAYRKKPFALSDSELSPIRFLQGETEMSNVTIPSYHFEFVPAHKYLGCYAKTKTACGEIWPGHDCDAVTDTVQNLKECHPIIPCHTAGWAWKDGKRSYFYGAGMPVEYDGEVPEGFELRGTFPESFYIVFSHPPFDYARDNAEVMRRVEELAWSFDPTPLGYEWNEEVCQDYQRHYPEGLGYHILRPVKKLNK